MRTPRLTDCTYTVLNEKNKLRNCKYFRYKIGSFLRYTPLLHGFFPWAIVGSTLHSVCSFGKLCLC